MNLRIKSTLFFALFFLLITLAVVVYVQDAVRKTVQTQTTDSFRSIAEQSEGGFIAYLEGMRTRLVDWISDPMIQSMAKDMARLPEGSSERAQVAKRFATYITEKKMPYDKTVVITDLLDHNGIIVASTKSGRVGKDEKDEEQEGHKEHNFTDAIISNFGEVFFGSIVFAEEESTEPVINATVRIVIPKADGTLEPLDMVLLVYFANTQDMAQMLGVGGVEGQTTRTIKRVSSQAFLQGYKTSDIYLVNAERLLVTPSRYMKNVKLRQKVDTLPVRECLEQGKEVSEEYDNYQGVRVLGASMCLKGNGIVFVIEAEKDEVFAPLNGLMRTTVAGGFAALGIGVLMVILFIRRPLSHLEDIVRAAKRVSAGDLDVRVTVKTKDEIGYLASIFNVMIDSILGARKQLEASKVELEEKARSLEKTLEEHKKHQQLLEESKKATLNILEDLWDTKNKLQDESTKLQTIITSVGDGLLLVDAKYKIVLVNPKAIDIFTMPEKELIGKDLRDIITLQKGKTELPITQWPIEEMFLTKSIVVTAIEDELSLMTAKRKAPLPVAFSIAPLKGGLFGGVIIVRDATADRALDEAKSGFISVASHQLRTPLTSIRWYSEMLLSGDAGSLNEAQRDFLKEVHSGAERLYQTVDLLLGISRVESGKVKIDRKLINLTDFTDDIRKELTSQIDEKHLGMSVVSPEGQSVTVSLDPIMLRQVIINLLSNAIRYTNNNGNIEVKWSIDDISRIVTYSVRDDGIGIPVAQRNNIFTKFFRAENARTQVPDGSGLGLALVKELVESWGGTVWFETEEGKGTTFFFTIPIAA